jgi:hypothetical protein
MRVRAFTFAARPRTKEASKLPRGDRTGPRGQGQGTGRGTGGGGGGQHCRNWLEQFKQLGEVQVEEVDSKGFKCFEEGGEKLCRVWLKMDQTSLDDLF